MIIELESVRMGHAPDTATCSVKQTKFKFDEKLLMDLPEEVVEQIKRQFGLLTLKLVKKVAKDGCPQFEEGKCRLQNMGRCTG